MNGAMALVIGLVVLGIALSVGTIIVWIRHGRSKRYEFPTSFSPMTVDAMRAASDPRQKMIDWDQYQAAQALLPAHLRDDYKPLDPTPPEDPADSYLGPGDYGPGPGYGGCGGM